MEDEDMLLMNSSNTTDRVLFTEHDSLNLLVPLSIIYATIFVAGVLGNIATCVVILRNRSMHTATNFYLISLAFSDMILLICGLPLEVYRLWVPFTYPLAEGVCIAIGFASETSANATVLTITAFTIERYIAICRPFISRVSSKQSRAVRYIVAIWVCALCTAVPQAMQFGIVTNNENGPNVTMCTVKGHGVHQVFVISSLVFFVVPMSVITVLYALIGFKLRMSRVLHPPKRLSVESNDRTNRSARYKAGASQRRVIKMLVVVALSFFVCWAPFHVQRLLAIYGMNLEQPTYTFYTVYIVLTYLSGVLYYLSTAINPFLYNIMSNKFRNAFKMTLSSCCRRKRGPSMGGSYTAMMERRRALNAATSTDHALAARSLGRQSTATTFFDAPPRVQRLNGRDVTPVSSCPVEHQPWRRVWRIPMNEPSNSIGSPGSISNSSLGEVEEELSGEELATFMYKVNCEINGGT